MADTAHPRAGGFTVGRLPAPIYRTLREIQKQQGDGTTQRQVVVAGVLALVYLSQHDRDGLKQVWAEVERWCPGTVGRTAD